MVGFIRSASFWIAATSVLGCASPGGSQRPHLTEYQHELYRTCMSRQLAQSSFGSGMSVHEGCLRWARTRVR